MLRNLLNKIWFKISVAIVILVLVIMALVTYFFTLRQLSVERQEIRNNMGRIAKQIASIRLAETKGWFVYQEWIDNIIASDIGKDLVYIAIFDENKTLAAFGINYNWLDLGDNSYLTRDEQVKVVESLAQGQVAEESLKDFDHYSVNIRMGREMLGQVDVGFSLVDFNNRFRKRGLFNLYLLILFLLVAIISSIVISLRITKPINMLSDAMIQVSKGNFENILPVSSNDEIGVLAGSYNYMINRLHEKNSIEQFTKQLGFTYTLTQLGKVITEHIVTAMDAVQGVLMVIKQENNQQFAHILYTHPTQNLGNKIELDNKCVKFFSKNCVPCHISKLTATDCQQLYAAFKSHIQLNDDFFLVPITSQNVLMGLLLLQARKTDYNQDELEFLSTLSKQSAMALENANLLSEMTEKERLSRELEIAKSVQQRLLPQQTPDIPGLDISGICLSTDEIGGDYYDYFVLDNKRIGLAIADVSGKGASAAFYMSEIKGMMSALAFNIDSPRELIMNINKRLYESVDRKVFATMIYGILDLKDNSFTFVRAGHNALLVTRNKHKIKVDMFIPAGIGLGLTNNKTFEMYLKQERVILNKNDTLVLYTDGITEAMNINFHEFGEEKLVKYLSELNSCKTKDIIDNLLKQVKNHAGDSRQFDDITMIAAKIIE